MIGRGCNNCNGTGYRGRQGIFEMLEMNSIFEMLEMNSTIRQLAFDRAPLGEIRKAAIASGMRNLLHDGKMKIRHGITTPTELVKITQCDDLVVD